MGYFIEEDGTDTELSVTPTKAATESAIGEMSQSNEGGVPIVGETVTLSEAVEEVEIVVGEELQEVARDVQHSEPVMARAVADGFLEVKRDCCRWEIEAALCELLPAPILALAQFDEETGSWGNSCLAVLRRQEKPEVKKGREFLLPSRSPPWYRLSYFQSPVKSRPGIEDEGSFFLSQTSSN